MPKTIYFVAGEASGDNHGAALMGALCALMPDARFVGRGGPQMKALGQENFHDWIDRAAVVGLWEVIKKYGYFRAQFRETIDEISRLKPDAIVLIDYPGFNLRLARALRKKRGELRIIYYISPQVWAWHRGRIKGMARSLDLMLCIFPFEAELYNKSGLRTIFVGHPMPERLQSRKMETTRDPNLIALFPGSRRREIRKIMPVLVETAAELRRRKPQLHFEVVAASSELAADIEAQLNCPPNDRSCFTVNVGHASASMQQGAAGIVASGSATLEAAYFRLPFVLIYKVSWLTYLVGRLVVKVDYLGMPNVLANRPVVPEFIQHEARPRALAEAVLRLLDDSAARSAMLRSFDEIIGSLGPGGASQTAAHAIADEIAGPR